MKTKKYEKEPDFLCSWDFCNSCIDFRIRYSLPLTNLKSKEGYQPYFRVQHPEWRATRKFGIKNPYSSVPAEGK